MMKKTCFLFLLLLCGVVAIAQDFEIVSVESLPADMSAREDMKTDHNDRQCALLRVATQNIAPEQREGFSFVPDLGSEVVERATRDGEIWLWVSPGIKYLRIKHRDWGQYELRLIDHVARVESLHTYKIVIKGTMVLALQEQNNNSPTQQYLVFQLSPTNAMLEVDGQLWEVAPDGTAMKFVNFGTYSYRVQAPNHLPETGKVTVDDPNNTKTVNVKLKSDFVEVTLQVDADAEIWVNNEKKGTRTWIGQLGKGTYKIECKKEGHETSVISKEITAEMNGKTITLPAPTPIYGSLNVESTPIGATIYIDGKSIGKTPMSINEILVGRHEIRLLKEGYMARIENIVVKKEERTQVNISLNDVAGLTSASSQKPELRKTKNFQFEKKTFILANFAYSLAPQISYGLTIGSVKKLGWFLNVTTNFVVLGSNYECDDTGEISEMYSDGYTDYTYTDQTKKSRLSCTAGMVVRLAEPISVYFGGGVGYRRLFWMLEDGTRVKNTNHSYGGFSFDGGLMFHFKVISFSVGVQTLGFNYAEAKAGIGFTF